MCVLAQLVLVVQAETDALTLQGAIVLFCAPGTICSNNTIIARTRNVLGAINMCVPSPLTVVLVVRC